jgi:hypothetical protein
MAETTGLAQPPALQMVGETAAFAGLARAAVAAAEHDARDYGNGLWLPDEAPLFALRASLPEWSWPIASAPPTSSCAGPPFMGMAVSVRPEVLFYGYGGGSLGLVAERVPTLVQGMLPP